MGYRLLLLSDDGRRHPADNPAADDRDSSWVAYEAVSSIGNAQVPDRRAAIACCTSLFQ
jgi:hypothetical protein